MKKLDLSIVGCGALTELVYLPLLKSIDFFNLKFLVDVDLNRLKLLQQKFKVDFIEPDIKNVIGKTDAALIVLPNFLHAQAAKKLLDNGIHVLVEKPMATHTDDCNMMIKSANSSERKLAVGMVRRFYKNVQFIEHIIKEETFGKLLSYKFSEGHILEWPVQSDAIVNKEKSGGGVLMDTGVHTLDLIYYWVGEAKQIEYFDDNMGGVESESFIKLEMDNGVRGQVSFSRIRELSNNYKFYFERADVEMGINSNSNVSVRSKDNKYLLKGIINDDPQKTIAAFKSQLWDFYSSIIDNRDPFVSGKEGIKSVSLIEKCYTNRKDLKEVYTHF